MEELKLLLLCEYPNLELFHINSALVYCGNIINSNNYREITNWLIRARWYLNNITKDYYNARR